jgi:ribosome-binding protein aMBF1 (putative translation factor)
MSPIRRTDPRPAPIPSTAVRSTPAVRSTAVRRTVRSARSTRGLRQRLGANLRRLRRARGLTQAALAQRARCHPNTVGRLERGATDPTLDTLARLAHGLGCFPGDFFAPAAPAHLPER